MFLKKGWKSIHDENRHGRLTMVRTAEMVDYVNAIILANGRITTENISEKLGIVFDRALKMTTLSFRRLPVVGFN